MKRFRILLFLFLLYGMAVHAKPLVLSEAAEISLLTSTPIDDRVYTLYGHTSVRVHDPQQNVDLLFNYGIFSFDKPNFIYRFAKGETDYMLEAYPLQDFVIECQIRGSGLTEQVLNFTQAEKQALWEALVENAQPENRVYRYNFFFDNCATRPAVLVEKYTQRKIDYADPGERHTFRELINYCTRNHPWLTFGCDLVLGSPTDREATPHEEFFLPQYLERAFAKATILQPDGSTRPLVKATRTLTEEATRETSEKPLFTPLVCSLFLLAFVLLVTWTERRKKTYYRWVDVLLFSIAGLCGIVLFFLSFISVHPSMWPNVWLIWLHPLHLAGAFFFMVKKLNKAAYFYHFINFAALTLLLLGTGFVSQHVNEAFIPLILCLWIRSGYSLIRKKWNIE